MPTPLLRQVMRLLASVHGVRKHLHAESGAAAAVQPHLGPKLLIARGAICAGMSRKAPSRVDCLTRILCVRRVCLHMPRAYLLLQLRELLRRARKRCTLHRRVQSCGELHHPRPRAARPQRQKDLNLILTGTSPAWRTAAAAWGTETWASRPRHTPPVGTGSSSTVATSSPPPLFRL